LQGGLWKKLIQKTVIVIALIVNIYLYTEIYMHASEILNLLLLIQRKSENLSHKSVRSYK